MTKVIFNSEPESDGKFVAIGVEYLVDGKTEVARVSKEVIIAAGALQTPQLLELSGNFMICFIVNFRR